MTASTLTDFPGLLDSILRTVTDFMADANIHIIGVESILALALISILIMMFSMQIIAWVTPPNPKFVHAIMIGGLVSVVSVYLIYRYEPIAPALINASIVGVYGWQGYLWVGSIIVLVVVFLFNAIESWKKNKPLEVLQ